MPPLFSSKSIQSFCSNFFLDSCDNISQIHLTFFAVLSGTQRNFVHFFVLFTYNDDIRYSFVSCFTNLVTDLFSSVVCLYTDTSCIQFVSNFFCVVCEFFGNRQYFYLYGSQPCRELTCEVFDQNTDCLLYTSDAADD